jgi:deoxyribonuclease V
MRFLPSTQATDPQPRHVPFAWRSARTVAGLELAYDRDSKQYRAAFVALDARTLEVVDNGTATQNEPLPAWVKAWEALEIDPDVVIVQGPDLAEQLGLVLGKPTLSSAKTALPGSHAPLAAAAGAEVPLVHRGQVVGQVMRLKRGSDPVYVSPGHLMDASSAAEVVRRCSRGYHLPEPIRQAHLFASHLRMGAGRPAA